MNRKPIFPHGYICHCEFIWLLRWEREGRSDQTWRETETEKCTVNLRDGEQNVGTVENAEENKKDLKRKKFWIKKTYWKGEGTQKTNSWWWRCSRNTRSKINHLRQQCLDFFVLHISYFCGKCIHNTLVQCTYIYKVMHLWSLFFESCVADMLF